MKSTIRGFRSLALGLCVAAGALVGGSIGNNYDRAAGC